MFLPIKFHQELASCVPFPGRMPEMLGCSARKSDFDFTLFPSDTTSSVTSSLVACIRICMYVCMFACVRGYL